MAVSIRLRREGNRNRLFFRIVVTDSRKRRDGRFIDTLGAYDPNRSGVNYQVDLEKADRWIAEGASPSETVSSILRKARKNPEASMHLGKQAAAVAVEATTETPVAEKPAPVAETPAPEPVVEEAAPVDEPTKAEETPAADEAPEAADDAPAAAPKDAEAPAAEEDSGKED
ncbi:MAG: 30S ribosomal protein S16 [Verrucomicrobiota bacterium]